MICTQATDELNNSCKAPKKNHGVSGMAVPLERCDHSPVDPLA